MDPFKSFRQANLDKAQKAEEARKQTTSEIANIQMQETITQGFKFLVDYLDDPQRISKTAIVNQLKSVGTPDAMKVVSALDNLHQTLKTHKNTDLTPVTELLKKIEAEAKSIPKNHKDIVIPDTVKVSNLPDHSSDFKNLLKAIEAIKLVAEAPVVNIPAPEVNVEAPNLTPIKTGLDAVEKAVRAIVIPEPVFDISPLEKQQKKTNKLLNEFLDSAPSGGGGGGGGLATPYQDANGLPTFPRMENGGIPVAAPVRTERYDYAGNPIYVGSAPLGSSESDAVWYIEQYDLTSSSNALGMKAINVAWDDRATETYS